MQVVVRYIVKNKNTGALHHKIYNIESIESNGLSNLFDIENYVIISRDLHTGLTDKNGVKIFEGDMNEKGQIVCYFEKLACYGFKSPNNSAITFLGQFNGEIIGNIHE